MIPGVDGQGSTAFLLYALVVSQPPALFGRVKSFRFQRGAKGEKTAAFATFFKEWYRIGCLSGKAERFVDRQSETETAVLSEQKATFAISSVDCGGKCLTFSPLLERLAGRNLFSAGASLELAENCSKINYKT